MKPEANYFDRAGSWASESIETASRSRRIAWFVAGAALAIAAILAIALVLLLPLKTVQSVTLLVDRQTGFVQALDPNSPKRIVADEALTQSYLAQYVSAREGFDRATVSTDYRKVALLSSGSARSTYLSEMPATNPSSPFQRYQPGSIVSVRIKSVSKLQANTALVRFDTQISDRGGLSEQPQPWVSVIRYQYSDAPMSVEDRFVNPLGFQVLSYRRDAEAPQPAEPPSTAAIGLRRSDVSTEPRQLEANEVVVNADDGSMPRRATASNLKPSGNGD